MGAREGEEMSKEKQTEEAIPADEVIQALKCCASAEDNCYNCPLNMKGAGIKSECCITAMSRAALDLIYRKQSEWISVEERLPDVCGMPVLMVAENEYGQTNVVKGFTDYTCPVVFHTNEMEYYGIWRAWKVTHWMPLPKPPKGDRHE
jgi:hypothetical protein